MKKMNNIFIGGLVIFSSCFLSSCSISKASENQTTSNVFNNEDIKILENKNKEIQEYKNQIDNMNQSELNHIFNSCVSSIVNNYKNTLDYSNVIFSNIQLNTIDEKILDDFNSNITNDRIKTNLNTIPYFVIDYQSFYMLNTNINLEIYKLYKRTLMELWNSGNINYKAMFYLEPALFQNFENMYINLSILPYILTKINTDKNLSDYVYSLSTLTKFEKSYISNSYNFYFFNSLLLHNNNFISPETINSYQYSWMSNIEKYFDKIYDSTGFYDKLLNSFSEFSYLRF